MGNSLSPNLWEQLTNQLKGLGYGILTENDYKRRLTDWKSKTKAKAADIDKSKRRTGGGPSPHIKLSQEEERLLGLMGKSAVRGDDGIQEFGVGRHYVQEHSQSQVSEEEPIITVENPQLASNVTENDFLRPSTDWETYTVSPITYELVDHDDDHTYSLQDEPNRSQRNLTVTDSIKTKNMPEEKSKSASTNIRRKLADMTTEIMNMNDETLSVLKSIDNNLENITSSLDSINNTLSKVSASLLQIINDKTSQHFS